MGDSAFVALQRVARSFEDVRTRREITERGKQSLHRLVRAHARASLPLLGRELMGADDAPALWAVELLLTVADDDELVDRVVDLLTAAADGSASETGRMMAIAVLAQLGSEPEQAAVADSEAIQLASVQELAHHLGNRPDIARAADHLVHNLEPEELLELVELLCAVEGRRAAALIDELVARDDLLEQLRSMLLQLAAPLRDRRCGDRSRPRQSARACFGSKPGATSVLVASVRLIGSRPERHRGICCALAPDGRLVDAMYREDYTPRGLEREIVRPLRRDGFTFRELEPAQASALLGAAAAATHRAGHRLPRAYFLGRDILGLHDEHVTERRRSITRDLAPPLLSRALELMAVGDYEAARPLIDRHRQVAPDDADGAAALGLCLLAGDRPTDALVQLRRASALAPDRAEHHWNRAATLHRLGDRSGCFLALRDYVRAADRGAEPDDRTATAEQFVREYERRGRLDYPRTAPVDLAHAEQLAATARRLTDEGRSADALSALQSAVEIAPEHVPSWTALGIGHARRGDVDDARRCLDRALAVRPDHLPARRALEALARDAGQRPAATATRARPKRRRPAPGRRGARFSPV